MLLPTADNRYEGDATAFNSDASTVSMGEERSNASSYFEGSIIDTNQDSYLMSDIGDSIMISSELPSDLNQVEQSAEEKKVGVLDIFNRIKPSKIRKEIEEPHQLQYIESMSPDDFEKNTIQKTRITAKDILTGIRPTKWKDNEAIQDLPPVTIVQEFPKKEIKPVVKSGITARDILTGKKKKESKPVLDDIEMIEVISSEEEEGPTQVHRSPTKKRASKRSKQSERSLMVTLKYKPRRDRIADLESKIRSSTTNSVSAKDLLKQFGKKEKPQMLVSLKIDKKKLKQLMKDVEPIGSFFTKGTSKIPGAKSFLDMLSYKAVPAKNPIHKLKEIPTPAPTKEQIHVTPETKPIQHRTISLVKKQSPIVVEDLDYSIINQRERPFDESKDYRYASSIIADVDIMSIAKSRVPTLETDQRYSRFLQMFGIPNNQQNNNNDLWCDYFRPQNSHEVLFDTRKAKAMRQWLKNSFKILKKKTKRPNVKRPKKADQDELGEFMVDEVEDDTEEEPFVPIMILSGPEGVGKTSAVYSMVEELSGYVYEINASQARGRKDIMANLKELSTTQLVHQNQGTNANEFQKGVILFEDVDILFESDKGFWSVMEHVLSISRRPIILTCSDIGAIPNNIIECAVAENTLHKIARQPVHILSEYLFLVALTQKVEIDEPILEQIVLKNSSDLRKCISSLQIFCELEIPDNNIVQIHYAEPEQPCLLTEETNLKVLLQALDRYSISDILDSSTKSLINHEIHENEILINDPFINEEELRTSPLPFEFSLGSELRDGLPLYPYGHEKEHIQHIKKLDEIFLKSRLKEPKRITRNNTMSIFDFDDNLDAKDIFRLPASTYTSEVSPFFRTFSRYESRTDYCNAAVIQQQKGQSVEELLRAGFLTKKKFSAKNDMLLYEPYKYWNV